MPKVSESKYLVMAGWSDVPHLDEKTKRELRAATPPHLRKAREFGIPVLGSGAVFPVAEDDILVDPLPIPDTWPQVGGMDFGWDHPFGAARLAWNRDIDCIYVTQDFRQSELTPALASIAMAAWDKWLPWAWPHDGLQHEKGSGEELAEIYKKAGFNMMPERAQFLDGKSYVEPGITEMLERMQTGRWKVFRTCAFWIEEYRLYHRKDGLIQKIRDDVISASRYALMMKRYARCRPARAQSYKPRLNWRQA